MNRVRRREKKDALQQFESDMFVIMREEGEGEFGEDGLYMSG